MNRPMKTTNRITPNYKTAAHTQRGRARGKEMNLKQLVGDRCRVTMDESWSAETPENRTEFRNNGEEWRYQEIKGKYGLIYPYDQDFLSVSLTPKIAKRCMGDFGSDTTVLQMANDAITLKAPLKFLNRLLRYVKPKKIREYTPEQKAALASRLAAYRFKRKATPQNDASGTFLASNPRSAA